MTATVHTRVELVGFHNWPDAPAHRDYLADRHRHTFHVCPTVVVSHDNRDVEYHDLRDIVAQWWQPEQGGRSCEMMARDLIEHLSSMGLSVVSVEVNEDGADGSTVYTGVNPWD